jgi:hypothetical protein
VQLFIWKACHNILPTKRNLHKRSITPDGLCPVRQCAEETTGHALWNCPGAQDVWLEASKQLQKCVCDDGQFVSIFRRLKERLDEDKMCIFMVIARQIWLRRNAIIHGDVMISPEKVIRRARSQLDEYMQARQMNTQSGGPPNSLSCQICFISRNRTPLDNRLSCLHFSTCLLCKLILN